MASGVRSSCEALATNRRCAANAPSSRSSSPSMVSARSFSSSPGPGMASRSCRLSAEIRRVAAVIRRSGRSTRCAVSQPSTTETTVMMASAITEPITQRVAQGLVGSMSWAASWSCRWLISALAWVSSAAVLCGCWSWLAAGTVARVVDCTGPGRDEQHPAPVSSVSRP